MSATLLSDVLRIMSLAVDSETVAAYCAATWGKDVEIYEDVNPENPPKFESNPQIHICADNRHRDPEQIDVRHTIILALFADPGRPTALADSHVTYYPGRANLEGLARLVERAASEALLNAAISFEQVPVDPDKLWGRDALGVYYCYQINFHDPLYT